MDRQQLEMIISTFGRDIYSFCHYLTKDTLLADELYQDVFLTALHQDKIDFTVNPKSYLLGVAVNLWRNRNRKFAIRQQKINTIYMSCIENTDIPDDKYDVDEIVEKNEIKKRVHCAVDSLQNKYKIPVLLFYMEEMSISQISDILKIPQGTVKSRLYKARKILEKQLEGII